MKGFKKGILIFVGILVLAVIITVIVVAVKPHKDKTDDQSAETEAVTTEANETEATETAPTATPEPKMTTPIYLPFAEDETAVVFIEGLSDEDAANLDNLFRYYETTEGNELEVVDETLAQPLTNAKESVLNWFNPEFDLQTAFNERLQAATDEEKPSLEAVMQTITDGNHELYYRQEEDGYHMSAAYYYLGYHYSSIPQQFTSTEEN